MIYAADLDDIASYASLLDAKQLGDADTRVVVPRTQNLAMTHICKIAQKQRFRTGQDDIDRQVALRMERQNILAQPSPPDLWLVLTESVVRVQVGGPPVMQSQLRRLIDVAERPNVTLQVLPFTTAAHVHPISPFTILEFPDAVDPTVVYLEHLTGSLFLEADEEVSRYTVVFDHLRAEALGTAASIDLIAGVAAELERADAGRGTE